MSTDDALARTKTISDQRAGGHASSALCSSREVGHTTTFVACCHFSCRASLGEHLLACRSFLMGDLNRPRARAALNAPTMLRTELARARVRYK